MYTILLIHTRTKTFIYIIRTRIHIINYKQCTGTITYFYQIFRQQANRIFFNTTFAQTRIEIIIIIIISDFRLKPVFVGE